MLEYQQQSSWQNSFRLRGFPSAQRMSFGASSGFACTGQFQADNPMESRGKEFADHKKD